MILRLFLTVLCVSGAEGAELASTLRMAEMARVYPKETVVFFCLENPGAILDTFAAFVAEIGSPYPAAFREALGKGWKDRLGFDLSTRESWLAAGFDPSQPMTRGSGFWKGSPWYLETFGVANTARAMETVRQDFRRYGIEMVRDPNASLETYRAPGFNDQTIAVIVFRDRRLFRLMAGSLATDCAGILKDLMALPPEDSLGNNSLFRRSTEVLPQGEYFSGFVAGAGTEITHPLLKGCAASAFSVGDSRLEGYLALDPDSPLARLLQSGLDCNPLIARLDRPDLAFSLSLDLSADTFRLLDVILKEVDRLRDPAGRRFSLGQEELALLEKVGGKLAVGVAVYFSEDPKSSFDVVAVGRFASPDVVESLVNALFKGAKPEGEPCGNGKLYPYSAALPNLAFGQCGDSLFVGPSERIRRAIGTAEARWSPRCGGMDLLSAECFRGGLFGVLGASAPSPERDLLSLAIPREAGIFWRCMRKEEGLRLSAEISGRRFMLPGALTLIAGKSIVESQRMARETATLAMLQYIYMAEEAFREKNFKKGSYGTFAELVARDRLDDRFRDPDPVIDGFRYSLEANGKRFRCVARGTGEQEGIVYAINEAGRVCSDEQCTKVVNRD
ncbi:MAG: hypothetical protein KA419_06615 [Acidobacteria bacterium]|nr:hypothetical protein [Acidobacteriota bacterium]